MRKKTKILVIGGTGFVGSYLVKLLTKDKTCQVLAVGGGLSHPKEKKVEGASYHYLNLTGPVAKKELLPITENLDTVVVMTPPDQRVTKNIIGLLSLVKNLKKIIHISTLLVYPSGSKPVKETAKPKPFSFYEKNKIREEKRLTDYSHKKKIKLCIVRLANVYGDVMNRGIVGLAFKALLKGGPLMVNGNGEQVRDYIFVEDAVKLIKSALVSPQTKPIEIFNVSTGQGYTVNEVLEVIKKITGGKLLIKHGLPVPEKKSIIGDNAKILKLSGYRLAYDLFRGLTKTDKNYFSKHESF